MSNTGAVKSGKKNLISEFFKETFRRHSGSEYSELLTRGMRGGKGVNRKYPWAYIRLFALLFVLLAVFILIVRFTSNELFVPTITVFAAVTFNLSFLMLLYELYPNKDLSFMSVCLALLLGGALANVITQILFSLFVPTDAWLNAVYTGFFEELTKMLATIAAIVVSRKTSPLAGFLLGAAVGCGYSIAEDMGYVFIETKSMTVLNLSTLIDVSVARGLTAVCTHTLWTAVIGWAYSHFSRHWANVLFYLVTLLSCGLHIAWDLPLSHLALGFIYAGCAVVIAVEVVLILYFERKKTFKNAELQPMDLYKNEQVVNEEWEQAEQNVQAEQALDKKSPLYWRHWGHFVFVLGAFLMAVIAMFYCSVTFSEKYGVETFKTAEEYVLYMQNGLEISEKKNRPYNSQNSAFDDKTVVNGVLVKVVQREADEKNAGVVINYEYTVSYDKVSGKDYYFPAQVWVEITDGSGTNVYYKQELFYDGLSVASYFPINGEVTGTNIKADGDISVFVYNPDFERDLTDWRYLSLFITFACIFGAACTTAASLYIKSWRVKKCLTETASSVR